MLCLLRDIHESFIFAVVLLCLHLPPLVIRTYEERTKLNYDHPDAFDTWLMVEHIKALKEGKTVDCPTYSFVEHNRAEQTLKVEPSKVVIVDGILIFENEELRNIMDINAFDYAAERRIFGKQMLLTCDLIEAFRTYRIGKRHWNSPLFVKFNNAYFFFFFFFSVAGG